MFGLPLGLFVESAVAILMALTIGYCIAFNHRLKMLHADKGVMRQMAADLIGATNLANQAIKELKQTAVEADLSLNARLEEAERFGIELANHVNDGSVLMDRIARIAGVACHSQAIEPVEQPNKVRSALEQLQSRVRTRRAAE
ncbi:MAG: DUF6468 domain-containing protein [Candidatus Devosia euplotis]|nr:DUF6468 domain-containing protein [Candidatus Devosia euplotis]